MNGADGFLVVFSGMVAVSTLVYALLTWRLVSETKRLRMAQTEPAVSVTFQSSYSYIYYVDLCIRNDGGGPAFDINLKVDEDSQIPNQKRLSELNIFKGGMKYLGPGEERRFFLTYLDADAEDDHCESFEVYASYRGAVGKTKTEQFVIDLSELKGLYQVEKSPMDKIAREMERLTREFKDFRRDFNSRR